jgi:hypothetical protein
MVPELLGRQHFSYMINCKDRSRDVTKMARVKYPDLEYTKVSQHSPQIMLSCGVANHRCRVRLPMGLSVKVVWIVFPRPLTLPEFSRTVNGLSRLSP